MSDPREVGRLPFNRKNSGNQAWGAYRWISDGANRYPQDQASFRQVQTLIKDYILPGHLPPHPLLKAGDNVVALGSCFARELRNCLNMAELSSDSFWIPAGLNNSFALLDFISWCITGAETEKGYRYDRDATGQICEWTPTEERAGYLRHFQNAGAIVLTFGLAEVWEDKLTGGVFWRGVPDQIFDSERHVSRVTTVEENQNNMRRIIQTIRLVNPQAPIIFTLSPVPLKATFRDISCMTADSVSKSILRVALDQTMRESIRGVFYWPSYEIVKRIGSHTTWQAYGLDDDNVHHVSICLVFSILQAFVRVYFDEAAYQKFCRLLNSLKVPLDGEQYYKVSAA